MSRIRRTLRANAAQFGVPGALALGLIAFAGAFCVSTHVPARERLRALQVQAARAAVPPAAPGLAPDGASAFADVFPAASAWPDLVARIYAAAHAQRLELRQGDYRVVRDTAGRLVQYQLTFPVTGPYPQLRRFVAAALADVPTLTLASVKFERKGIGEAVSEAQLKFVVYLGKTS